MGLKLTPGDRLHVTIFDPFDLAQEFDVAVAAIDSFPDGAERERILVNLPTPLEWGGIVYDRLVLERRSSPGLVN